jgi:hypothetical protein
LLRGSRHNRGLEGGIIDTDRAALEQRLGAYFSAENFRTAKKVSAEIATARARYDPEKVWEKLKTDGHYRKDAIVPLLTFPFDRRYIYYVGTDKWLNEARQEFARNASDNEWLVTVPEPRKASETWPVFSNELVNLHVHERGSVVFPRETRGEDLLADRDANIPEATWRVLREHFGLKGERRDDPARALTAKLFRVAFGILHAPSYQAEHKSALSADWAHLPIPRWRKDRFRRGERRVLFVCVSASAVPRRESSAARSDCARSRGATCANGEPSAGGVCHQSPVSLPEL